MMRHGYDQIQGHDGTLYCSKCAKKIKCSNGVSSCSLCNEYYCQVCTLKRLKKRVGAKKTDEYLNQVRDHNAVVIENV